MFGRIRRSEMVPRRMQAMKPLIYIAGPYTHPDPVENTHKTIHAAEEVESLGAAIVIPHLSLLWHIVSPAPIERWYERDLAIMHRCDALVRLPGNSSGADAEVEAFDGPAFLWPDERTEVRNWIERWMV